MKFRIAAFFMLVTGLLPLLHGQTLTVTNSTSAPSNSVAETGMSALCLVGAFDLAAAGGNVSVASITLSTAGSGDWTTDINQTDGIQLWLDGGDLSFSTATDALIGSAGGATPMATVTLGSGLNITSGSSALLWVVLRITSTAGASIPETFSLSIANASDVALMGPGTVVLGSPSPQTSTLSVVTFFVTSFVPTSGGAGQPITVTGSGFTAPVSVTIAGNLCPGTPVISGGGTQITGLTTPGAPGKGDHPIVLTTGLLGPRTLSFTFAVGGEGGQTGCQAGESAGVILVLSAVGLALVAYRQRKHRAALQTNARDVPPLTN